MNLPENIQLPFFAYGLFKPGELCYFKIKDLVQATSEAEVNGRLKERDGIPLLVTKGHLQIKGVLIHFKVDSEEKAYKRIAEIEPDKIYKWQEINTTEGSANALLGKRPDRGSKDIDTDFWDGKSDPLFKYVRNVIQEILKENSDFDPNYTTLFPIQMAYTLLWSALERYAGLRYHFGNDVTKKVNHIATEEVFRRGLSRHVKQARTVYSAIDPADKYTLEPNNPKKSIKYYYQVRSNAVHRGKAAAIDDFKTVKKSLEELLAIFDEMLNEAWATSK